MSVLDACSASPVRTLGVTVTSFSPCWRASAGVTPYTGLTTTAANDAGGEIEEVAHALGELTEQRP